MGESGLAPRLGIDRPGTLGGMIDGAIALDTARRDCGGCGFIVLLMPFLKLLRPLATSPIMSEKRPLPNNSKMITPTTSQCQRLKPPMIILQER